MRLRSHFSEFKSRLCKYQVGPFEVLRIELRRIRMAPLEHATRGCGSPVCVQRLIPTPLALTPAPFLSDSYYVGPSCGQAVCDGASPRSSKVFHLLTSGMAPHGQILYQVARGGGNWMYRELWRNSWLGVLSEAS